MSGRVAKTRPSLSLSRVAIVMRESQEKHTSDKVRIGKMEEMVKEEEAICSSRGSGNVLLRYCCRVCAINVALLWLFEESRKVGCRFSAACEQTRENSTNGSVRGPLYSIM